MHYRKHQRGSIYMLEFSWLFGWAMAILLGITDLTRYLQYREQLQSAAFAVVTVLANRDYYYRDGDNPPQELMAYQSDIDRDGTADVSVTGRASPENDYDTLRALATTLLPEGSDVGLVIEQWQESVAAPDTLERVAQISNPGCIAPGYTPDSAMVTPVYVVALCDHRSWRWHSSGLLGGAFETIQGEKYRGIAVMSSRNNTSVREVKP